MSDQHFLLLTHLISKVHPISTFFKALISSASAFDIVCYLLPFCSMEKICFRSFFSPTLMFKIHNRKKNRQKYKL